MALQNVHQNSKYRPMLRDHRVYFELRLQGFSRVPAVEDLATEILGSELVGPVAAGLFCRNIPMGL